jgi:peroxiredoxin
LEVSGYTLTKKLERMTKTNSVDTGKNAPPFSLINAVSGEMMTLQQFAGQDAIIVFLRGTWCPFCREQLAFLRDNYDSIARANVALIAIACQSRAGLKRYLEENPMPFPVLADEKREAAKAYGSHYWLTYEGFNLAQPSLFILDKNHHITYAHVGKNMRDLPVSYVMERFVRLLEGEETAPSVSATTIDT